MDPEEFRRFGHQVVDWIADYRARAARAAGHVPRRARVRSGRSSRLRRPTSPRASRRSSRDLDRVVVPGLSHWQHPRFFGYFPSNGELVVGPRRLPEHRPRRPRPLLAVEPGADRARGGDDRLGAADDRPLRRPGAASSRTRPRRARWSRSSARASGPRATRSRAAGCRARASRSSSTSRPTATARSRRRRCWPASAATNVRVVAHDERYAMRPDALDEAIRGRPRRRPEAVRRRGHDRHHDHDRPRPDRRDRARSRASTASGCTSTPRWPARP